MFFLFSSLDFVGTYKIYIMKTLDEIVLEALKQGSDYYGEKIIGVSDRITQTTYSEDTVWVGNGNTPSGETHKHYTKYIDLENPDGSECCAGVGLYIKDNKMSVCSGRIVFKDLDVTDEMQIELDTATIQAM